MQNKNLLVIAILSLLLLGCNNSETTSIQLPIQSFVMNKNCFSSQKLQQTEVVITNAADYKSFEDSIRVFWFQSCDTIHLPIINFDSSFFVGKYTQAPGDSVIYESNALFQADQVLYTYMITVTSFGTSGKSNTAFNCAIIPRQSEQINVQMLVEYRQK